MPGFQNQRTVTIRHIQNQSKLSYPLKSFVSIFSKIGTVTNQTKSSFNFAPTGDMKWIQYNSQLSLCRKNMNARLGNLSNSTFIIADRWLRELKLLTITEVINADNKENVLLDKGVTILQKIGSASIQENRITFLPDPEKVELDFISDGGIDLYVKGCECFIGVWIPSESMALSIQIIEETYS